MRDYGLTNEAAYASAPAVGPAGDSYWNTTGKVLYVSDGSVWNAVGPGAGGPPTGAVPAGDLQGSYPSPTIKPSALPWSISGATLLPTDAAKTTVQVGSGTTKARLIGYSAGATSLSNNQTATAGTGDDAAKPTWELMLDPSFDNLNLLRRATPAGGQASLLKVDANGNLLPSGMVQIGGRTMKDRWLAAKNTDQGFVALNANLNAAETAWVQDDVTKASWVTMEDLTNDLFTVGRIAPGGTGVAQLLRVDSAGVLTLPGDTANGNALVVGSQTIKGRVFSHPTTSGLNYFTTNHRIVGGVNTQDDTSKASWLNILRSDADVVQWHRLAAGATTSQLVAAIGTNSFAFTAVDPATAYIVATGYGVQWGGVYQGRQARGTQASPTASLSGDILMELSGNGWSTAFNTGAVLRLIAGENWTASARGSQMWIYVTPNGTTSFGGQYAYLDGGGNWVISGPVGQKSTGTTWQNPSDPRLKRDVAPYCASLAEICALEPITYRLKADPDRVCYGFDAERVRDVFPECVTETRMKLDPADEEETDGVLVFDMNPILVALINAVKELNERLP